MAHSAAGRKPRLAVALLRSTAGPKAQHGATRLPEAWLGLKTALQHFTVKKMKTAPLLLFGPHSPKTVPPSPRPQMLHVWARV